MAGGHLTAQRRYARAIALYLLLLLGVLAADAQDDASCQKNSAGACISGDTRGSAMLQAKVKIEHEGDADADESQLEGDDGWFTDSFTDPDLQVPESFGTQPNGSEAQQIIDQVDSCIQARIAVADDAVTLRRLQAVRTAEILDRLLKAGLNVSEFKRDFRNEHKAVLDAAHEAGVEAADAIVHEDFENLLLEVVGGNATDAGIKAFEHMLLNMQEMCEHTSDDKDLVKDEDIVLHGHSSGGTPHMSMEEARIAVDLADYIGDQCKAQVLDLGVFVGNLAPASQHCSGFLNAALLSRVDKETHRLDYYAKSALALHDVDNELGSHFVDHLRGDDSEFGDKLHDAARVSGVKPVVRAQLNYIDNAHYELVHGYRKEAYCNKSRDLLKRSPTHWISTSKVIQSYNDCLCVQRHPALHCDGKHKKEFDDMRGPLLTDLRELEKQRVAASLAELGGNLSTPIGLGPCQDPVTGIPVGIECSMCVNGNCVGSNGEVTAVNPFVLLQPLFSRPAACIDGSCAACMGIKPGDPLVFKLAIGAKVTECEDLGNILASFRIYAALSVCVGGKLGAIAGKLGWDLCESLGELGYYPFMQKMQLDIWLPVPLPPPLGVRAALNANVRFGDVTGVVYKYCQGLGSSEYNCLMQMFEAQGKTGVTLSLDVLMGVKIPFVGEVGKWIQTMKYSIEEDRDSKEIAANKADVTVVYIGKSGSNLRCGKVKDPVDCESNAGNKDIRANHLDTHSDTFNIYKGTAGPRSICVRRTDSNNGWNMKLELACKTDQNAEPSDIVYIGSSSSNTRCIITDDPVDCAANSGDQLERIGFDSYKNNYHVYESGDRVCARRTDSSGGWGLKLELECDRTGEVRSWNAATLHIGTSKHKKKCLLPEHDLQCASNAGNKEYRVNNHNGGDAFNIYKSGHWICCERTNGGLWGMDLKVQCQQHSFAHTVTTVTLGSSSSNKKCVLPNGVITCDKFAGDKIYRANSHSGGDSFNVFSSGKWLCARRKDSTGGWKMDLKVRCLKGESIATQQVDIGSSRRRGDHGNTKCVSTGFLVCEAYAGDKEFRVGSHSANDKFEVWNNGQQTCARRTDSTGGWNMNLKINCIVG